MSIHPRIQIYEEWYKSQTHIPIVDPLVFVIAADEVDLVGIACLQSQQQTNRLEGVRTTIHVVPQEQVIE